MKKRFLAIVAALIISAAIALSYYELFYSSSSDSGDGSPLRKVVLIGIDGADWQLINPLIAEGELPNIKRVVEEGASGPLLSIEPMLSPLLWTTIATGKMPEDHGILSFTVFNPKVGKKVPITSNYRKVDALWNVLSNRNRLVDVVAWLATYPAEEVNGMMVTDRIGYLAFASPSGEAQTGGEIFPPEREEELRALVVKNPFIMFEEIKPFLNIPREEFESNKDMPFDPKNPVNNMILLYASFKTIAKMGLHLLEKDNPDLLSVYFELVDATGHLFMPYAPPKRLEIDSMDYHRYKDAIKAAYKSQDMIVGEFLKRLPDNAVIILVSDHGFKSAQARLRGGAEIWAGKAAKWHRIEGIISMYGPGIKRGFKIQGASILDVTPTVLALEGLPDPSDMPGRILKEAFTPELRSSLNAQSVATLESGRMRRTHSQSTTNEASEEAMKKLKALGYIAGDSPDAHNNLGQRYQKVGQLDKAIAEYKKALELKPNFPAAINNMGICYGKQAHYDKAKEAFLKALKLNPSDAYAMNNMAVMFMQQEKLDMARQYGERAVAVEPTYANAYLTLGAAYAGLGKWRQAERCFKKVLEIEPGNKSAIRNLRRLGLHSGGN